MQYDYNHLVDKKSQITLILILILLVLRIPFTLIVDFAFYSPPSWASDILELGMYIFIGALLWINRDCLADFHINRVSVWIYILSCTILRFTLSVTTISFWVFGLIVLWMLIRKHLVLRPINNEDYLWAFRGLILGFLMSVVLSYFLNLINPIGLIPSRQRPSLFFGVGAFFFELAHAALPEEMIFRGFLWGYMKSKGWEDKKILILQAGIFWLAHLNYYEKPYTLWITVPLLSLILGIVVWRSRSIASSMVMHAVYNSMRFFI